MARAFPHQCPRAWQIHIKYSPEQVPVCSFERSFEGGKAGEAVRVKDFADVVP